MKILVSGSTGFIGRYVLEELSNFKEIQVISTARGDLKSNFSTHINYDLKRDNEENLYDKFNQPDRLIHLAWEGLPNYMNDFHMTENLPNHIKFLKNLIDNGLKNLTVVGTCFEYGLQEGCLNEEMPCYPSNYYALAKDSLRRFLEIYCAEKEVNLKWVRLFYIYGEGQNPNSLIPQLDKAIADNLDAFNMSGGEQIRDYLPVEKVAENIVKIALQDKVTGIINNCSGNPKKLVTFVQDYLSMKKSKIKLNLGFYPYSPIEPMEFWGDNRKLKQIL
ncbi:MAG: NAD-dependent epimerase/dehydratase family protein [Chitinophagales bacterium]|nr:NAD-dependent epimerase/dehydratase family protein [Chitinophagales bacterium]